jgi:hypothetical protein
MLVWFWIFRVRKKGANYLLETFYVFFKLLINWRRKQTGMSFFKMPTLHSIVIHDFLSSLPVVKYLALLKTGILHLSEEKQLLVVQRG